MLVTMKPLFAFYGGRADNSLFALAYTFAPVLKPTTLMTSVQSGTTEGLSK
jgi:hypothetical protein